MSYVLEVLFKNLEKSKYLSEENGVDLREQDLQHLATKGFFPFSKSQCLIFEKARKAHEQAQKWLKWRGYTVIIGIPVGLALSAMLPFKNYVSSIDNTGQFALTASLIAASIAASNVFGMIFTGTYPDRSSDLQNEDQDVLMMLKGRFDNEALYALREFQKPGQKAKMLQLAQDFLEANPTETLKLFTTQKNQAEVVFDYLMKTMKFIASNGQATSFDSRLEEVV
ncbi:MAG: hypothetical protein A2Y28_03660 [Chlamydiae bacterium GWC2_50_10]|nr:MAG: hypothetical protein A2Z85_05305 [Chlamydiae bacterium GWA2_50_15]OGN53674.1 MAG: hypothetical protein A2Y28_03660 [Chlamydiae bacterium GWC2_50_10]OGN56060.1 MAG: hypothetical protein A2098_00095 [Chlamydiae bacterium GWF2_49_8]OGN58928.1 MAG: hypothetical protein A3D18_01655 [Chlamydiae bacterium RIFCSPHIGHO2_02_FULL_49_29]OGN63234.1 MAG: hypothetical protein A3E26_03880 [Chlamydiae bacterium RIFCSPHIGHO2_12_FULL_49_32]OGN67830.1 MAG: hypothetical protein A3I15_03835 [Chlamydiae bact